MPYFSKIKVHIQPGGNIYLKKLLYSISFQQRFVLRAGAMAQAFVLYEVLQLEDTIEYPFGSRRATGHIHVYRYHLVYTLQYRIRIEYTTAGCTGTNSDNPTGLCHLQVYLAQNGAHLFGNGTGYQQHIALAGREAHTL